MTRADINNDGAANIMDELLGDNPDESWRQAMGAFDQVGASGQTVPREIDAGMAERMAALFSGEAGEHVLAYLIRETLCKATWPGDLAMSRDELVNYGCWREGQNSIVILICRMVRQGRLANEEGEPA